MNSGDRPLLGADGGLDVTQLEEVGHGPAGGALRGVGAELAGSVLDGVGVDAVDPHHPLPLLADHRTPGGHPRHANPRF